MVEAFDGLKFGMGETLFFRKKVPHLGNRAIILYAGMRCLKERLSLGYRLHDIRNDFKSPIEEMNGGGGGRISRAVPKIGKALAEAAQGVFNDRVASRQVGERQGDMEIEKAASSALLPR